MQAGDKLPLFTQLANYDDTQFPLAVVTDADGEEIDGSPFALEAVDDSGLYSNVDGVMPDTEWVHVDIKVYSNVDHTTLSVSAGGTDYLVFTDSGGGSSSLPPTSNIIGVVDSDSCSKGPIEDTIVQGSDRTLTIRLVEEAGGEPFSISGYSLIQALFRKADGTILTIASTDITDPIQVVSAAAGKFLVVLTDAQTALLAALAPSPFVIKVTIGGLVTVVNFPTQVAVVEADVQ